MKQTVRYFLGAFVVFYGILCTTPANAQSGAMTFQRFLQELRDTHPALQAQELRRDIASAQQKAFLGAQDWRLGAQAGYYYNEPNADYFDQPEKAYGYLSSLGVEKALWSTGGRLALKARQDQFNISPSTQTLEVADQRFPVRLGPGRVFESGVFLEYRQPLLRNFGGTLDRLQYELAGFALEAENFMLRESQEDFLLDASQRFIDWEVLTELRRIAAKRIALAEQQRSRSERQASAQVIAQVDAFRARSDVLRARQGFAELDSQWNAKRAELEEILGMKFKEKSPALSLYEHQPISPFDQLWDDFSKRSRVLQALETHIMRARREEMGTEENLKPDLGVVTAVGIRGDDDDLGGSASLDRPDAVIGVEFSYPLGNRTAKAENLRASKQLQRLQKDYQAVIRTLRAEILALVTRLEMIENELEISRSRIRAAKATTAEELVRYNRGDGDFAFVLQSQDSEQQAQEAHVQTSAQYRRLSVTLQSLLDRLL